MMKSTRFLLSCLAVVGGSSVVDAQRLGGSNQGSRSLSFACSPGHQPKRGFFVFGCDPCPPMTYKDAVGSWDCYSCPVGTRNSGRGNFMCFTDPDYVPPGEEPSDDPPVDPDPHANGGAKMDPHIQKWDGTWYDYSGECDLVLLKVPNFDGENRDLTVHIRSTIRQTYSFISDVAVKIGDSALEFSSWGQLTWDSVAIDPSRDLAEDPSFEGYQFSYVEKDKKTHTYKIKIDAENEIEVSSFKDFVNVNINVKRALIKNSVGLMGDAYTGKSLARDGVTVIDDINAFGQEWQVLPTEDKLFLANREPQAPQKCRLPEPKEQRPDTEEDAILRQAATKTCTKFAHQNIVACVADVMATGDLTFAKSGVY